MTGRARTVLTLICGVAACRGAHDADVQLARFPTSPSALRAEAPTSGDQKPVDCAPSGREPAPKELELEWQKTVFATRADGGINVMHADDAGVLVAGRDLAAARKAQDRHARPFVARYTRHGRKVFHSLIAHPRGSTPLGGTAIALAGAQAKLTYVLVDSWSRADPGIVLAQVDESGRETWSTRIDGVAQPPPVLAASAEGGALVAITAHAKSGGRTLKVMRFEEDGGITWARDYPYDVAVRGVASTLKGGFLLAGMGNGVGSELSSYQCGGQTATCETPSRALWLLRIERDGTPSAPETVGTSAHALAASDLAALPDGFLVTGEFSGPPLPIASTSLCELEPGMPPVEPIPLEPGARSDPCDCLGRRADLFILRLDAEGKPRWGTTLAVGRPRARVAVDSRGHVMWAATVYGSGSAHRGETSLWRLDGSGAVVARRTLSAGPLVATSGDGSIYVSDTVSVGRALDIDSEKGG